MPVFVNQVEITDEQVFREMQYHPAESAKEAMQRAAEALAIRELLLQEASSMGLIEYQPDAEAEPEADDTRIQKLLLEVIKVPTPDDMACRRFYQNNKARFIRTGKLAEFSEVQSIIAAYLQDMSWHTAVQQYVKILVGRAKIAGLHLEGAETPLVQ